MRTWVKTLDYVTSLDILLLLSPGVNSCWTSSVLIVWLLIQSIGTPTTQFERGQLMLNRRINHQYQFRSQMIHIQTESVCQTQQKALDDVTKGADTWLTLTLGYQQGVAASAQR